MTTIAEIRAGLADNLATISGLRTTETIPDNPSPPIAIIDLKSVTYNGAFHGGLTTYSFTVTTIVGRASEREAQRRLDAYISTTNTGVKKAVESDKSLGGAAYDVIVTNMTNIGTVSLNDTIYLAADFAVEVYAN